MRRTTLTERGGLEGKREGLNSGGEWEMVVEAFHQKKINREPLNKKN